MKAKFVVEVSKVKNSVMLTDEEWNDKVKLLKSVDEKGKKTTEQYNAIRRFVLLQRPDGVALLNFDITGLSTLRVTYIYIYIHIQRTLGNLTRDNGRRNIIVMPGECRMILY